MLLKVLIVLAFVGILSGLARLFKQEEIDLDNENKELVKCSACGEIICQKTYLLCLREICFAKTVRLKICILF